MSEYLEACLFMYINIILIIIYNRVDLICYSIKI